VYQVTSYTPQMGFQYDERYSATGMLGAYPWNIQSFPSFQMVQVSRIIREFRPFCASLLTVKDALSHNASKEESTCGASIARLLCRSSNQNCLVVLNTLLLIT